MLDFDIKKCTRKCAATGRELRPGEKVYSTLIADGGEVKRLDYGADAWSGPPDDVISWWQFEVPESAGGKVQWAPSDVIRNYFKALAERDDEQDKRYILALLMVRRRMMRLEETEAGEDGVSKLVLYCPKDEREYFAPIVEPTPERVKVIQDELAELLFGGGVAGIPESAKSDSPGSEEANAASHSETEPDKTLETDETTARQASADTEEA